MAVLERLQRLAGADFDTIIQQLVRERDGFQLTAGGEVMRGELPEAQRERFAHMLRSWNDGTSAGSEQDSAAT